MFFNSIDSIKFLDHITFQEDFAIINITGLCVHWNVTNKLVIEALNLKFKNCSDTQNYIDQVCASLSHVWKLVPSAKFQYHTMIQNILPLKANSRCFSAKLYISNLLVSLPIFFYLGHQSCSYLSKIKTTEPIWVFHQYVSSIFVMQLLSAEL